MLKVWGASRCKPKPRSIKRDPQTRDASEIEQAVSDRPEAFSVFKLRFSEEKSDCFAFQFSVVECMRGFLVPTRLDFVMNVIAVVGKVLQGPVFSGLPEFLRAKASSQARQTQAPS